MPKTLSENILIVKLSALGDIVQALDALQALDIPQGQFHTTWALAEGFEPLLEGEKGVDKIISVPRRWSLGKWLKFKKQMKGQHFNRVIDLQGLLKSWLVSLAVSHDKMITFGPESSRDWLVPRIASQTLDGPFDSSRQAYRELILSGLKISSGVKAPAPLKGNSIERICLAPGAGWPTKQLDKNQWTEIFTLINRDFPRASIDMLWGSDKEREWIELRKPLWKKFAFQLAPKMNLTELKEYLKQIDLYIGMDSGPTHLAAHLGVQTLTFFGPSMPTYYSHVDAPCFYARAECHLKEIFEDRCQYIRKCNTCTAITSINISDIWSYFIKQKD